MYIHFVEVVPCNLLRAYVGLPLNPRLGWFSEGESRASGTASNGSNPPPPPGELFTCRRKKKKKKKLSLLVQFCSNLLHRYDRHVLCRGVVCHLCAEDLQHGRTEEPAADAMSRNAEPHCSPVLYQSHEQRLSSRASRPKEKARVSYPLVVFFVVDLLVMYYFVYSLI